MRYLVLHKVLTEQKEAERIVKHLKKGDAEKAFCEFSYSSNSWCVYLYECTTREIMEKAYRFYKEKGLEVYRQEKKGVMVSKTQTRLALTEAFKKIGKDKEKTKDWFLADFRHAVFKVVTECRNATGCKYVVNPDKKTVIFKLYYTKKVFDCIYYVDTKNIEIKEWVGNTHVKQCVGIYPANLYEFPKYMKELQPKYVIKRKVVNNGQK